MSGKRSLLRSPGGAHASIFFVWTVLLFAFFSVQVPSGAAASDPDMQVAIAPPSQPVNPSPADEEADVALDADIGWDDGGNADSYDVYFGTDPTPDASELVASSYVGTTYEPGPLAPATTYYWRIDAWNPAGTTTGTVWSFSTLAPPPAPSNPIPADGAQGVSVDTFLSWNNPTPTPTPRPDGVIEDFEDNDLDEYTVVDGGTHATTTTAAHDGTYGLATEAAEASSGWIYRDDEDVLVMQGDTVSCWVRLGATGRAYFGFGASGAGAYSLVVGANPEPIIDTPPPGDLILQLNDGYSYADLASVSQIWTFDHWYRLEVEWSVGGDIAGRLYDSDGTTLLNTVSTSDTTYTEGGIAFRAFDEEGEDVPDHFDTVERTGPATLAERRAAAERVAAFDLALSAKPRARSGPAIDILNGVGPRTGRKARPTPSVPSVGPTPSVPSVGPLQSTGKIGDIDITTGQPFLLSPRKSLMPRKGNGGGGSVLWDLTHGVYGAYQPSGAYHDLVLDLEGRGYTVTTTTQGVDSIDLSNYDILVVCLGSAWYGAYSASEITAIVDFVDDGGGLFIMGDNPICPNANVAAVAEAVGITCGGDEVNGDFSEFDPHPIFAGCGTIQYIFGGTLTATWPGQIVGGYGGAILPDLSGVWGAVAVANYGGGRVVCAGDINFCENSYIGNDDNLLFCENVFDWLLAAPGADADYEVYFGRAGSAKDLIYTGHAPMCLPVPSPLSLRADYEWFVVATNDDGPTTGPLWTFKTEGGRLRALIAPPEAITAGAMWRAVGTGKPWRPSGFVETLPAGTYSVRFKDTPGYATPPIQNGLQVLDYQLTTANTTYPAGLQATIDPSQVIALGARWRVVGTGRPWRPSEYIETGLAPGDYTIRFKDLPGTGWKTPARQLATVVADAPTFATGTYEAGITALIAPPGAIVVGAKWRIVGIGPWRPSGYVEAGLPTASYTVRFRDALGFTTPANQTAGFVSGQPLVFNATYVVE